MPRTERPSPAELTRSWPDTPSTDYPAEQARLFALNLRAAIGDESQRAVARLTHVDEGTIRRVLSGAVWPDLRTIALLEEGLSAELFPRAD